MSTEALKEIFSSAEPLAFTFPVANAANSRNPIINTEYTSTVLKIQYAGNSNPAIIAPFSGKLFYRPEDKSLGLVGDPSSVLKIYSVFGDNDFIPKNLIWFDIDIESVLQKFEAAQGDNDFTKWREAFMMGEASGNVNCGDLLGNTLNDNIQLLFAEDDGTYIHTLYALWNFWKLIQQGAISAHDDSSDHPLINSLGLPTLNLIKVANDIMTEEENEFIGSYRNYYIDMPEV